MTAVEPTTSPKWPAFSVDLVDVGARRGPARGAHRARRGDLVGLADEGEHRAGHVGEGDQPVLDHEAAGDEPVVDAELADHVGERRAGPGDPALRLEEAALALAREQRLAVVELADELQPLAQRLGRVEHPEAGPAEPGGHAAGREDVLGEEGGRGDRRLLGEPEGERPAGVDGAAEDDDRVDPLRAPVGGDLVAEHPALAVAADVDLLAAGLLADPVDRLVDREHVVVERALEPALLVLGRAEVDDPGSTPSRWRIATALVDGATS